MTGIYKTGTISLASNSNIVTGNGTLFQTVAAAREGDLFTLDGEKFYEIYQVDTETQLRIRNLVTGAKYQGEALVNANFAIVRNFSASTPAQISADVVNIQQRWHQREREMTEWFASDYDYHQITDLKGDRVLVVTPAGLTNLVDGTRSVIDYGLISSVSTPETDLDLFLGGVFHTQAQKLEHQPTDFGYGVKLVSTNISEYIFYQQIIEVSTGKVRFRVADSVENATVWRSLGGEGEMTSRQSWNTSGAWNVSGVHAVSNQA